MSYEKAFLTVRVLIGWALPCLILRLAARASLDCAGLSRRYPNYSDFRASAIAQQYNVAPQLNSEFSVSDNVYIVKGDRNTLKALKSPN